MGAKSSKTEQGKAVQTQAEIGSKKLGLANKAFAPARDYVNREAVKDFTDKHRGYAAYDAAQAFSKPIHDSYAAAVASGRGLAGLSRVNRAAAKGYTSALGEGTKRGTFSRDTNIARATQMGVGQQASSGAAHSALASMEFKKNKAQADIAAQEANALRGAAWGLASIGAGKYMQSKNDELRAQNLENYQNRDMKTMKDVSYSEWAQGTKGKEGGFKQYHDSGFYNFLNNFSGGGF